MSDSFPLLQQLVPNHTIATYEEQKVARYRRNPLIEALGPVKSVTQAVYDLQAHSPVSTFDPAECEDPPSVRLAHLGQLKHYIYPQRAQVEFICTLDLMIRDGYVGRIPNTKDHFQIFTGIDEIEHAKIENLDRLHYDDLSAEQLCDALFGYSGAGKTATIKAAMRAMGEVIFHPDIHIFQIPVVRIECTSASGIGSLFRSIIEEIDMILPHFKYRKQYIDISRPLTVMGLLGVAARLCTLHCVGILIVEEIQKLDPRNKSEVALLNQILTLCNVARVPVLFTGTNAAAARLWADGAVARRTTGIPPWERLNLVDDAEEFEALVRALLQFQWMPERLEYSPELAELLFYLSQGVLDFVKKLIISAQKIAIRQDARCIQLEHFTEAYERSLSGVHEEIEALRSGLYSRMASHPDYAPITVAEIARTYRAKISETYPSAKTQPKAQEAIATMQIAASLAAAGRDPDEALDLAKEAMASGPKVNVEKAIGAALKKSRKKTATIATYADRPQDYRRDVYLAGVEDTTVTEQLRKSGKIKPLLEIFEL